MNQDLNTRLTLARQAVVQGGDLARAFFGQTTVQVKTDGSELTQADLQVDALIRDQIEHAFNEPVLSEETIDQWSDEKLSKLDACWMLDPIDGTTNFANGLSWWGPILAYRQGGEVQLAAVAVPMMNLVVTAVRGEGAYLNDTRLQVADRSPRLTRRHIIGGTSLLHLKYAIDLPCKMRILGSQLDACLHVADGTYQAALIGGINAWERWAVALIIREAGGVVTPIDPAQTLECGTTLSQTIHCKQSILLVNSPALLPVLRAGLHPRQSATAEQPQEKKGSK